MAIAYISSHLSHLPIFILTSSSTHIRSFDTIVHTLFCRFLHRSCLFKSPLSDSSNHSLKHNINFIKMVNINSFLTGAAVATLFTSVIAGPVVALDKRNGEPPAPSCSNFSPFVYAGCFVDPSTIRGLLYDSGLFTQNMTVEQCVSFCKGMFILVPRPPNAIEHPGFSLPHGIT